MLITGYILAVGLSISYIVLMARYIYHWQALALWETPEDYQASTRISIIIPVRNEAKSIEACVRSVLEQNYPTSLFELFVVDDHSTDHTLKILKAIQDPRLKILSLADYIQAGQSQAFKKKALEIAIDQAQGDLILTTDGDCVVPQRWLQRMAHLYEAKDLKFIAAPVNFHQEQNLLEYFQSIDFTGMMGITGAGIRGRFMNMCNGANLAYDKAVFYEVGGFAGIDHLASGDDMLLMQKVATLYPAKIGYLKHEEATVLTKAQPTCRSFFNQRIRWASKSADYKEWQVTAMLGAVWLFCIHIVFSIIWMLCFGLPGLWILLFQLLIKIIMDYALLSRTTRFFNRSDLMAYFLQAQILHILYIVSIGTSALFIKDYQWKDRKVR